MPQMSQSIIQFSQLNAGNTPLAPLRPTTLGAVVGVTVARVWSVLRCLPAGGLIVNRVSPWSSAVRPRDSTATLYESRIPPGVLIDVTSTSTEFDCTLLSSNQLMRRMYAGAFAAGIVIVLKSRVKD